ncbi:MAG: hypothetical protein WC413_01740 [Candidatus Nanoarchaeia archaeon]
MKETISLDEKDFLLQKKPITAIKNTDNYYVPVFDATFPKEYSIKQIKTELISQYNDFRSKAARGTLDDTAMKLWMTIVEYVDYNAICRRENENTPHSLPFQKRTKNGKPYLKGITGLIFSIPEVHKKELSQYTDGAWIEADIFYKEDGSLKKIKNIKPRPDLRNFTAKKRKEIKEFIESAKKE